MSPATRAGPLIAGLGKLGPHDHLCSIYEGQPERFAVVAPFIHIGLDRGEKCIYLADDGTEDTVREALQTEGIDVEGAIASNALVLATKEQVWLRHGSFDPDSMFAFWNEATSLAINQGFSALRAAGESKWALICAPRHERWMEYESGLTRALSQINCFALCSYDRRQSSPELILDVIRTHPAAVYRGKVSHNCITALRRGFWEQVGPNARWRGYCTISSSANSWSTP